MERVIDPEMQVLVVDDSDVMRMIISAQFRKLGLNNVKQAYSGKNALSVLEAHEGKMNLIVSDWNMPGMQGIDLLKAVRQHEKYKDVPFIMVTAENSARNVSQALNAGVSDFLPKPFTRQMLAEKICKAIKLR